MQYKKFINNNKIIHIIYNIAKFNLLLAITLMLLYSRSIKYQYSQLNKLFYNWVTHNLSS